MDIKAILNSKLGTAKLNKSYWEGVIQACEGIGGEIEAEEVNQKERDRVALAEMRKPYDSSKLFGTGTPERQEGNQENITKAMNRLARQAVVQDFKIDGASDWPEWRSIMESGKLKGKKAKRKRPRPKRKSKIIVKPRKSK